MNTIKVGIDLDCLLDNMTFSRMVLDLHSDSIQIQMTTESVDQLKSKLNKLFQFFPQLMRSNLFVKKEECQININHINIPNDWFDYQEKIVLMNGGETY